MVQFLLASLPHEYLVLGDLLGLFVASPEASVIMHCSALLCMFLCSSLPIFFPSLLLLSKGLLSSERKYQHCNLPQALLARGPDLRHTII